MCGVWNIHGPPLPGTWRGAKKAAAAGRGRGPMWAWAGRGCGRQLTVRCPPKRAPAALQSCDKGAPTSSFVDKRLPKELVYLLGFPKTARKDAGWEIGPDWDWWSGSVGRPVHRVERGSPWLGGRAAADGSGWGSGWMVKPMGTTTPNRVVSDEAQAFEGRSAGRRYPPGEQGGLDVRRGRFQGARDHAVACEGPAPVWDLRLSWEAISEIGCPAPRTVSGPAGEVIRCTPIPGDGVTHVPDRERESYRPGEAPGPRMFGAFLLEDTRPAARWGPGQCPRRGAATSSSSARQPVHIPAGRATTRDH